MPVLILDVTEAEADKILLTLDPLAGMAQADKSMIEELLRQGWRPDDHRGDQGRAGEGNRGEGHDPDRPRDKKYAAFAAAIRHAQANARVSAEVTVKTGNPQWWLSRMHRDQPDKPGWSEPSISTGIKATLTGKDGSALTIELARQILDASDREDEE